MKKSLTVAVGILFLLFSCMEREHTNPFDPEYDISSPKDLNFHKVDITTITLNWVPNNDRETGYRIDRKVGDLPWVESYGFIEDKDSSFTDSDAEINEDILYRVFTCYDTKFSDPVETPLINNDFPAPTNLNFEKMDIHTIKSTWLDEAVGEDGFKVEKKVGNGNFETLATLGENSTTFTDEDAELNQNISYRVYGYKGNNSSNPTETTTIDNTIPAPSNLSITQNSVDSFTLEWGDESIGEQGFKIERKIDSSEWSLIGTVAENIKTFEDSSIGKISKSRGYDKVYYRVRGFYGDSYSEYLESESSVDFPAPTNLNFEKIDIHTIKLTWLDEAVGEDGFKVEKKVGNGNFETLATLGENSTTFTDEDAELNQNISYRVYGYKGNNSSNPTETTTIDNTIPAPSNLSITQNSVDSFTLEWGDESIGEQGFKIERKLGEGNYQLLSTVEENITTFTDEEAGVNETVQYKVYTYSGDYYSLPVESTVISNTIPAPTNLSFEQINIHTIKLTWSDESTGEGGFKIEKKVGDGNFEPLNTVGENITTFTDEDANINESIQYKVYAYLGNESSASIQTTIIENSFSAPTNLSFQQLDITTIKLNWEYTSFGETGFKIDRKVEGGSWETAVGVTTETVWNDEGMDITKSYEYRVYAYYGESNSEYLVENYQYQPQQLDVEIEDLDYYYSEGAIIDINVTILSQDQYSSVESVKFYIDDNLLYTDDTEPYSYSWDSGGFEPNQYTIKVVAIDNFGTSGEDTHQISLAVPDGFVFVEGGTFPMGDHFNEGESEELPVHDVTLNPFFIGKYEVTQALYEEVMGNNPSNFSGENRPVEKVIWYDAVEFCNKLSEIEGLDKCYSGTGEDIVCDFSKNGYRLPTEAEWEYAARGGIHHTDNFRYSGCHEESELEDYAWYKTNSNNQTHEVGTKQPNQLGIYDMSGNVWEWCNDWYSSSYYSSSPSNNPTGPNSSSYRVYRGGSWYNYAEYCRVASRYHADPTYGGSYRGFRLVRRYE